MSDERWLIASSTVPPQLWLINKQSTQASGDNNMSRVLMLHNQAFSCESSSQLLGYHYSILQFPWCGSCTWLWLLSHWRWPSWIYQISTHQFRTWTVKWDWLALSNHPILATHCSSNQGNGNKRDRLEVHREFDTNIMLVGEPCILKSFKE